VGIVELETWRGRMGVLATSVGRIRWQSRRGEGVPPLRREAILASLGHATMRPAPRGKGKMPSLRRNKGGTPSPRQRGYIFSVGVRYSRRDNGLGNTKCYKFIGVFLLTLLDGYSTIYAMRPAWGRRTRSVLPLEGSS